MKPCWRARGLTEKGAALADEALPAIQALVDRFDGDVVRLVVVEASFRRHELSLRTASYRRQYLKDNE